MTEFPDCVGRIRKLTTTGTELWNVAYGGATTSVQGIATGPDANPVVAGYECTGDDCSSRITKQVLQYTTATARRPSTWRSTETATSQMERVSPSRR